MKRTMIVVLTLVLFGCSIGQGTSKDPIQSSTDSVTNQPSEELKKVVESLVDVKSIEWEIVFGYSIEDVRLRDALKEGRNISNVLVYMRNYYEEDAVQQYLYYLKRSNSQYFYTDIGVFWGDKYVVVGNIYKREAEDIAYDIEYTSIDVIDDITIVSTKVIPIYQGNYDVRGVKSSEYISGEKEITFHLRKDENGEYKITQFSDEIIESMEEEIGEEIVLYREREIRNHEKLNDLDYENESQKEAAYFVYDFTYLFNQGGLNAVYNQYEHLWISKAYADYQISLASGLDKFKLENLSEGFEGWDYGYDFGSEWLMFNMENGNVVSASISRDFLLDDLSFNYIRDLQTYSPYLNQYMDLLLGSNGRYDDYFERLREQNSIFSYHVKNSVVEKTFAYQLEGRKTPYSDILFSELIQNLIDTPRKLETSRFPYWKIDEEFGNVEEFSLVSPQGLAPNNIYDDLKEISNHFAPGDGYVSSISGMTEVKVERFYPEINLYIYDGEFISIDRETSEDKWKITQVGLGFWLNRE